MRSWLYLPPKPAPGAAPPPLVVRPYLGETYPKPYAEALPPGGLFANIRLMVGHGYAVLIPGLPRRRDETEPLAGLAERVLQVVDAAAARPDLAHAFDPDRLALWGHSYGGYSVLGIVAQTHRFRAAVASAPPTNLLSMWGTFQPSWRVAPEDGVWVAWPSGWVETAQGAMGGPPWTEGARYLRNSPALLADRIETPVLLFHGDQDPIPVTQSEQMFSALYRQGKTAQLVTYWGEDHLLNSPGTVRDLYARGFAWIDRFLADPVNATDGTPRGVRQARLPVADPALDDRRLQDAARPAAQDQVLGRQDLIQCAAVQQARLAEHAFQQVRAQELQAGGDHVAVEHAEVALAVARDDAIRQAVAERVAGEPPLPPVARQPEGRDAERLLDDGLGQQGIELIRGAMTAGVRARQQRVGERLGLQALGRREPLRAFEPGMAVATGPSGPAAGQPQACGRRRGLPAERS